MATNSVHSSIGFSYLTNNLSGMLNTSSNHVSVNRGVPVSPPPVKGPELPPPPDNGKDVAAKYFIGALAVAASAIAGIYIYKSRLKEAPIVDYSAGETNPITHYSFRLVEHTKDKFLEVFNKCPDLGLDNKIETTYQRRIRVDKDGKSILRNSAPEFVDRGLKRVDKILRPGSTAQTTFVQDGGTVRALIDWDDEGNLFRYWIKDNKGKIVRDYNFTEENVSSKYYYSKGGIKIKEVHYNDKGWTYERNYDKDGLFVNEHELNPELKNKTE